MATDSTSKDWTVDFEVKAWTWIYHGEAPAPVFLCPTCGFFSQEPGECDACARKREDRAREKARERAEKAEKDLEREREKSGLYGDYDPEAGF